MKVMLENREGHKEFNVHPDWYKNRKPGISAMIRCGNEEKWIVPCLESIMPFFDEVIVTVGPVGTSRDGTLNVLAEYQQGLPEGSYFYHYKDRRKLLVLEYPFSLREKDPPPDSVNDKSYYYNWTLSKTTHQIVAKWDVDMQMIDVPRLYAAVIRKNIVRLRGYNIVETDPYYLSKTNPMEHYEPRFMRINKHMHYVQAPSYMPKPVHGRELFTYDAASLIPNPKLWHATDMPLWLYLYRVYNALTKKDLYFKTPAFIHTKYLKLKENPEASWAPNWKEEIEKGEKLYIETNEKDHR
jgi:hypothetical protein